ncbi:MAG: hypothetical protein AAF629_26850 [Chloroflexota bacterium]
MAIKEIMSTFVFYGDEKYTEHVLDLVPREMVDPVTGEKIKDLSASNPWIWFDEGNDQPFGVILTYTYKGKPKTALSKLVIDPSQMADFRHDLAVYLCTAKVEDGEDDILLRVHGALLDDDPNSPAVYVNEWGTERPQPSSEVYDCPADLPGTNNQP